MTALNVLRQRRRATLYTDTAGYGLDGVIQGFGVKSFTLPAHRAVIGCRGSMAAAMTIGYAAALRFGSFDEIASPAGAAYIGEVYDQEGVNFARSGQSDIDFVITGWSESRNRPLSFAMSSSARHGIGTFEWVDADEFMTFPEVDIDLARRFGLTDAADPERLDPVADGIAVMQAQRHTVFPLTDDEGNTRNLFVVGGSIIATRITEDGLTQSVIHRWAEDRVGELITPGPLPTGRTRGLASPAIPMSRQQRRAAEREARKHA
ncbi:MAG: hypothetical protein KF723_22740 [Rhizobiaceae bacterium]|nr:hypothetical protein [Rhizobiaceae bacterium]